MVCPLGKQSLHEVRQSSPSSPRRGPPLQRAAFSDQPPASQECRSGGHVVRIEPGASRMPSAHEPASCQEPHSRPEVSDSAG